MKKTEKSELSLSERCIGYLRRLSDVAYESSSDKKSKIDGQIASIDQLLKTSEGAVTLDACESYAKVFEEILKSMYEVVDKLADEEKCDDYGNQTLFEGKKRSWKLCFFGVDSKRKETLTYSDVSKNLAYSVIQKCMWIFTPYLARATEFIVQIRPPGKWGSSFEVRCSDNYEELSYLDRENRTKHDIPLSLFTQMLLRYDAGGEKPEKAYDRKRIEKKQKFKSECAQNLMETVIRMYEILQSEAKEIVTVMPVQPELTYEI